MAQNGSGRTPQTPTIRRFGEPVDAARDDEQATPLASGSKARRASRFSLSDRILRRRDSRWKDQNDNEMGVSSPTTERAPIPSALASSTETASTPLPVLPMIVLSITMLGEFLSANVSTPFLLFMVEDFGGFTDEAAVGYWTGILVSCFFITQFLTSLLWATAAEKHGVRAVLFISLLGSSISCTAFGTSTSLRQAMAVRLLQGVFAGAIGVGRGAIATMSDPSNEGRAYAILGFCWGFGGVAGAIIGGSFENPAEKWPGVFGKVPLFVKFPYLLPTMIASAVTLSGAIMSLFLAYDGGPREGAIRLPPEKLTVDETIPEESSADLIEEPENNGFVNSLKRQASRRFSGYFARHVYGGTESPLASPSASSHQVQMSTAPTPPNSANANRLRSTSGASKLAGSAYGYSSGYRKRLASNVSASLAGRRGSLASTVARRRGNTMYGQDAGVPQTPTVGETPNFAARLLMANENAVTNIADLWVAAAINVDNEDPFESEDDEAEIALDEALEEGDLLNIPGSGLQASGSSPRGQSFRASTSTTRRPSFAPLQRGYSRGAMQRRSSSNVPTIFSHTGVRTPPLVAEPLQSFPSRDAEDPLNTIHEGQMAVAADTDSVIEKPPSLFSQLPIMIIIQYGLLALHATTHDQVSLSYLVSKYDAGGLNLNAGNFAQLIALMSLAQLVYQFYLYPNMGPPRGRFSHLSMFRIGSILFIPSYLSVILYRPFASATRSGGLVLMSALTVSTAVRFCASTFSYTAISILLNYMSPPHLLGLANGIAQSIVSLARFFGPILGGLMWSKSVDGNPSGYPLGFVICSAACAGAICLSFFIR